MIRTFIAPSALALAMLAAPSIAAAQTPQGDVAVSYSYLHDPDLSLPVGWVVAATAPLNKNVGIVGEVGGNYRSRTFDDFKISVQEYSFLGGVKVQHAASPRATVFGQMLAGTAMFRGSAEGESDSTFVLTLQPGGGVDVKLTPRVGVRAQGDYRYNTRNGDSLNQFRVAVGLVFGL
jgi:hypothetical protein